MSYRPPRRRTGASIDDLEYDAQRSDGFVADTPEEGGLIWFDGRFESQQQHSQRQRRSKYRLANAIAALPTLFPTAILCMIFYAKNPSPLNAIWLVGIPFAVFVGARIFILSLFWLLDYLSGD